MLNDLKMLIEPYIEILCNIFQKDTWQHLKQSDLLLVRHDNDCSYTFHKKAYAQIIDSFGEVATKRGLTIGAVATPFSRLVGERAFYSPRSYNQSISKIKILGKFIRVITGQNVGTEWVAARQVDLWCKILKTASPICVIGIQPNESLCRAGKLKNIPIYDIQHGVIADAHPWYGEIYRKDTSIQNLPDGFLCWDEPSTVTISKWAVNKGIRVLNVGNPWFLRFFKSQNDDQLVNEALAEGNKIDDDERPRIVVSLQWGLAIEYPDRIFNGVIVDALEQVILSTEQSYNWILRLHPAQLRGVEREMCLTYLKKTFGAEKTQKWLQTSELPLPVVLKKADLHITDSSTVVIEAAWLGIRSGLLCEKLERGGKYEGYFSNERNTGMAEILSQNPQIIKQWIEDILAKGHGQPILKDSGRNLDDFINEIARRKS